MMCHSLLIHWFFPRHRLPQFLMNHLITEDIFSVIYATHRFDSSNQIVAWNWTCNVGNFQKIVVGFQQVQKGSMSRHCHQWTTSAMSAFHQVTSNCSNANRPSNQPSNQGIHTPSRAFRDHTVAPHASSHPQEDHPEKLAPEPPS